MNVLFRLLFAGWIGTYSLASFANHTIAAGKSHTCAIEDGGTVACWGDDTYGQLGDGQVGGISPMAQHMPGLGGIVSLAAGAHHTCALTGAGQVLCWGYNNDGQLGNGPGNPNATPKLIGGLANVVAIDAGGDHTCAVKSDGGVMCWGRNNDGQLGVGNTSPHVGPQPVPGVGGVFAVATGDYHTCVINQVDAVVCWGANDYGQMGSGPSGGPQLTPTIVDDVDLDGAMTISAGWGHTCVLRQDGQAACWGANGSGQIGNGSSGGSEPPHLVIDLPEAASVEAGGYHTCATTQDGVVFCWGSNAFGKLGIGSLASYFAMPKAVQGPSDAIEIAAGRNHTCSRTESGHIRCWGDNHDSQLGNGDIGANVAVPQMALASGADSVSTGRYHTCALKSDVTVACWGRNDQGQVGAAMSHELKATPFVIPGLTGVMAISAGDYHTCAIRGGGQVTCWGANGYSQLGTSTNGEPSSIPLDVADMSDAFAVSAGYAHTCALKLDGTVWCWGGNDEGQLGTGQTGSSSAIPLPVTGLSDVTSISAGDFHTCAVTSGGSAYCWGRNNLGQLGTGMASSDPLSSPQPVVGMTGNVLNLSAGDDHTCATRLYPSPSGLTEIVLCWGYGVYGQLGNGQTTSSATPLGVGLGLTLSAVGGDSACALNLQGDRLCWGWNREGQLGTGDFDTDHPSPAISPGFHNGYFQMAIGANHACGVAILTGAVLCAGDALYGQRGDGVIAHSSLPVMVVGFGSEHIFGDGFEGLAALQKHLGFWARIGARREWS